MTPRRLFQASGIAYIIAILAIYYLMGADRFPDYQNYVSIAENGGWIISESEYFFEWISRSLLTLGPSLNVTSAAAVDILAIVSQAACCIFFLRLLLSKDSRHNFGATILIALLGVLFLTTTVRAAPAYLAASAYVLRELKNDFIGLAILVFGLSWHDSFSIPAAIAITTTLSTRSAGSHLGTNSINLDRCIAWTSMALVALSEPLRDTVLSAISIDLGLREAYLTSDEHAQSAGKAIYCSLAILICLGVTARDSGYGPRVQRFAALLALATATAYIVNGVAAVRVAMFSFCAFIPLRGYAIFRMEQHPRFRMIQLAILPIIIAINIADIVLRTI